MKYDMAGAAAMLSALRACAALGIRRNVVAVVPTVENMPSGTAFRPGDVLRMMSGKTAEILSTDAEGRLILADALTYAARKYRPEAMIDAATLTGACVVALGSVNMGMMGNDERLIARMKAASASSGERAWELPLHEEYFEQIKSEIGDLKNIGGPEAGDDHRGIFPEGVRGRDPLGAFRHRRHRLDREGEAGIRPRAFGRAGAAADRFPFRRRRRVIRDVGGHLPPL